MADHPDPPDLLGTAWRLLRSAERPAVLRQRAVVGDHAAFTTFYRAAVPGLVVFLQHHGAPLTDAAEVAQEAMIEAFRNWPAIRNPHAWVRTVAGRKLAGRLAAVEETPTEAVPEPTPPLPATLDTAEWEQRYEILRLLRLLPPRQRQVMAWNLDGYTPAEIADVLGLEPAAVRQNLRRARTRLATHLDAARGEDARDA